MFTKQFTFRNIFILSFIFRLIAVIFSKGYAFSDDHFETIEIAQRWLHHIPFTQNGEVYIFNLIYIGFHYIIFAICELLHIFDPQSQMFFVRFFHATFSLLSVYYGYKIAVLLTKNFVHKNTSFLISKIPEIVAFLLGLFWMFPFMSVRSLREFFCIPFLLIGFYHILQYQSKKGMATTHLWKPLLWATLFFSIAFTIRLQTVFFPLGVGLYFLLNKDFKTAVSFAVLCFISLSATQLLFDYYYWGNPFASLLAYVKYNAANSQSFPNGSWYLYILTVGGTFFLPASLLLIAGYFTNIKSKLILFIPSFLFFAFHSYFPNKQERFVLPFFPLIIILGVIGFAELYVKYSDKQWLKTTTKILAIWFLFFNTIALVVLSFTYTKRTRVDSMVYLNKKNDVTNILMETEGEVQFPPTFYLGKRIDYFEISATKTAEQFVIDTANPARIKPNYIIFLGAKNLAERLSKMKFVYPNITAETIIAPSFVDNIAYYLNPKHNVNESWFIYKIK